MTRKQYNNKKAYWRRAAQDWQEWAATVNLSYEELLNFQDIFETAGRKYGLLREFRENCIC